MRYYNFLTEKKDFKQLIETKCSQYLSLLKGREPLFRGGKYKNPIEVRMVRKNREAQGMSKLVADKLNNWLDENNHTPRDISLFCTSSRKNATFFTFGGGEVSWIFPINPIKGYTFIKARDINMVDNKTGWHPDNIDDFFKYNDTKMEEVFKRYFVSNKDFDIAYKNEYEIWFECDLYYSVSLSAYDYKYDIKKFTDVFLT